MQQEQQFSLAAQFEIIEDRLILASLPVLLVCFILWAIGSTFPEIARIINLIVTILIIFVFCVVVIRLIEVAWRWWRDIFKRPSWDYEQQEATAKVLRELELLNQGWRPWLPGSMDEEKTEAVMAYLDGYDGPWYPPDWQDTEPPIVTDGKLNVL